MGDHFQCSVCPCSNDQHRTVTPIDYITSHDIEKYTRSSQIPKRSKLISIRENRIFGVEEYKDPTKTM